MNTRRVLISGAGIAGPTAAYWLLRHGYSVTMIEHAPQLRAGGYMIDFWGIGYDVAERMGLLPSLYRDGYRIDTVAFVDERGRRVGGFDAESFRKPVHNRFISLPRSDLARRIFDAVGTGLETLWADSIRGLHQARDGVRVSFEHGPERTFDFVVGAEGLHSSVRRLIFGADEGSMRSLGYCTAAFQARDYPHRDERTFLAYSIPGAQVARYALRDGSSAFFFFFATDLAATAPAHDVQSQRAVIRRVFGGSGWECDDILDAMDASEDLYFDVVAQIRLPRWWSERVVLVGDAAYCPSLLSGQGSALAMAGAYVLANSVARSQGDYQAAFADYERHFRPFVEQKQRSAERFGTWFAPRTPRGIMVRNLSTRLMSIPFVADMVVARSIGDRFTLPEQPA